MTAGTASPPRRDVAPGVGGWLGRWSRSAIVYGIVAAGLAAVVGQWFKVSPPAAYGLCSACHGRDLTDWVLNHVEGKKLFITAAGAGSWPLLTVLGLVAGSFLGAKRNGEFATIDIGGKARQVAYGFIVMCSALFVGGCPTRIIIRTGYGDIAGALALAGVAAGVVLGAVSLRWKARR